MVTPPRHLVRHERRLPALRGLVFLTGGVALAVLLQSAPASPTWSFADPPPAAELEDEELDGDEGIDPTAAWLSPSDGRVQVYADRPSITPGEPLRLHTSTNAARYAVTVERAGSQRHVVFTKSGYPGHDYRARLTVDRAMLTARANWPASVAIDTDGWRPGVYTVEVKDSSGRSSGTVFAVRTPVISREHVLFVLPLLDYQAYNAWGGHSLYTPGTSRAFRVSFERPFDRNGGLSYWPIYDTHILTWLERQGYAVAYTTDYDLSVSPPDTAPSVLVLGQHTEYVAEPMYNWTERHVNELGDMSVADFGANSYYWQVRMTPGPRGADGPMEETCYKSARQDPAVQLDPPHSTVRWANRPVNRPISRVFGAGYVGIVNGGYSHRDLVITDNAPAWALRGTGWRPGTVLRGLLYGEADGVDRRSGGVAIAAGGFAYYGQGARVATISIRESPTGARVFVAGTFFFGDALVGAGAGPSRASMERFSANVLAWLWNRSSLALPAPTPPIHRWHASHR